MRKRGLSILLTAAMTAAALSGCSSSAQDAAAGSTSAEESSQADAAESEDAAPSDSTSDEAAETASGEEDNVIRVGVICSMTGGSAVYGEGAQNAVDMAGGGMNSGGHPSPN